MSNPAADYPASIHSPTDTGADAQQALGATSPTHSAVHGKVEQEIVAIETKLGTGASSASSATTGWVLTKQSDGTTAWAVAASGGGSGDMTKAIYDAANVAEQLVGRTASQTLTGKTISGSNNTLTNIAESSITNLTTDLAAKSTKAFAIAMAAGL